MIKTVKLLAIFLIICIMSGCGDSIDAENTTDIESTLIVLAQVSKFEGEGTTAATEFDSDFTEWYFAKYGKKDFSNPLQEISIEFNGRTYIAEYVRTAKRISETQVYYCYRGTKGELIYVDPEDYSLKSIIIVADYDSNFVCDDNVFAKSRKQAEEIAKKYITTEKYKLEEVKTSDGTPYFQYVQYLDGQKLPPALSFGFSQSGELTDFSCFAVEPNEIVAQASASKTLKMAKSFASLESDNALTLSNKKVDELCADRNIEESRLLSSDIILLTDGTLVKCYNYHVRTDRYDYFYDESGNRVKKGEDYIMTAENIYPKIYIVAQQN